MIAAQAKIDWKLFGAALNIKLNLAGGEAVVNRVCRETGVARTTLWRARAGQRILRAHFEKLCAWLGQPTSDFHAVEHHVRGVAS